MKSGFKNGIAAVTTIITLAVSGTVAMSQDQRVDDVVLDLVYNEEIVKKLLSESDPDVAFLARLKMMRGHMAAGILALERGEIAEALEHIDHPSSEILPEIIDGMAVHGVSDFEPALKEAADAVRGGDTAELNAAIDRVLAEISIAETTIDQSKLTASGVIPDAVVLLLRTAVAEYGEAFEYGTIINLIEYHDGGAFVVEARILLQGIAPTLAARSNESLEKITQSMDELETAWPGAEPPKSTVLSISKMLSLVTIIELHLNKLRSNT